HSAQRDGQRLTQLRFHESHPPLQRTTAAAASMAFTEFARQLIRGCHLWTRCRRFERGDCDLRVNEYGHPRCCRGCRKRSVRIARECSGDLLPSTPPAEKATAR